MTVRKRIDALVDALQREVSSTILLHHGMRLLPATIQAMRDRFSGVLRRELHVREDRVETTPESMIETSPGFPSVKPPKPTKH